MHNHIQYLRTSKQYRHKVLNHKITRRNDPIIFQYFGLDTFCLTIMMTAEDLRLSINCCKHLHTNKQIAITCNWIFQSFFDFILQFKKRNSSSFFTVDRFFIDRISQDMVHHCFTFNVFFLLMAEHNSYMRIQSIANGLK